MPLCSCLCVYVLVIVIVFVFLFGVCIVMAIVCDCVFVVAFLCASKEFSMGMILRARGPSAGCPGLVGANCHEGGPDLRALM